MQRELCLEPPAAAEVKAGLVRPAGGQLELRAQAVVRQNFLQEAVAVARRHHQRGVDDLGQHAELLLGRRQRRLGRNAQALGLQARARRAAEARDGCSRLGLAF